MYRVPISILISVECKHRITFVSNIETVKILTLKLSLLNKFYIICICGLRCFSRVCVCWVWRILLSLSGPLQSTPGLCGSGRQISLAQEQTHPFTSRSMGRRASQTRWDWTTKQTTLNRASWISSWCVWCIQDRWMDWQMGGLKRQTDRMTGRQKDRPTEWQKDRQTDRHTD